MLLFIPNTDVAGVTHRMNHALDTYLPRMKLFPGFALFVFVLPVFLKG